MDRVRKIIGLSDIAYLGLSGRDINVCVIDSGISRHIDFDNRIISYIDFTKDRQKKIIDENGHGTHVCGILAGSGKASNYRYRGVAPKANLIMLKVLDKYGNGEIDDFFEALYWIVRNYQAYNIKIVNISISVMPQSQIYANEDIIGKIQYYFDVLTNHNILVVTAAGNNGPKEGSLSLLGKSQSTLCVGCYDPIFHYNQKMCQDYSGRGSEQFLYMKPDIVAPGTDIVSCYHTNSYIKKSGTSMSCPIISGISALLMEGIGNYSVYDVMKKIRGGTKVLQISKSIQGYGMIEAKKVFENYM